jgi:hypothetical protein
LKATTPEVCLCPVSTAQLGASYSQSPAFAEWS